jgi:hypothetical protein
MCWEELDYICELLSVLAVRTSTAPQLLSHLSFPFIRLAQHLLLESSQIDLLLERKEILRMELYLSTCRLLAVRTSTAPQLLSHLSFPFIRLAQHLLLESSQVEVDMLLPIQSKMKERNLRDGALSIHVSLDCTYFSRLKM